MATEFQDLQAELSQLYRAIRIYEESPHIPRDESRESMQQLNLEIEQIERDIIEYSYGQQVPSARRMLDYISTLPGLQTRFSMLLALKAELLEKMLAVLKQNKPPALATDDSETEEEVMEADSNEAALALARAQIAELEEANELLLLREARLTESPLLARAPASDTTLRVLTTAMQLDLALGAGLSAYSAPDDVSSTQSNAVDAACDKAGLSLATGPPPDPTWAFDPDISELSADTEAALAMAKLAVEEAPATVLAAPAPAVERVLPTVGGMLQTGDQEEDPHLVKRMEVANKRIAMLRGEIADLREQHEERADACHDALSIIGPIQAKLPTSVKAIQATELFDLQVALLDHLARLNMEVSSCNRDTDATVRQFAAHLIGRARERQEALTLDGERQVLAAQLAARRDVHYRTKLLADSTAALTTSLTTQAMGGESPVYQAAVGGDQRAVELALLDLITSTDGLSDVSKTVRDVGRNMVSELSADVAKTMSDLQADFAEKVAAVTEADKRVLEGDRVDEGLETDPVVPVDAEVQTGKVRGGSRSSSAMGRSSSRGSVRRE
ncbi:Protein kinase domain [Carpediemonas membranifera]|uniref:Protein kinase domain n=1 Tax=Carpediemonas membranifera TaxID=201153 RepID=A0A8J6BXX5_9EUKA|nr:Protein kinase domain [Carpediemonas membranifera]|eukprot:KAG9393921.1 Protein kinase domain [Carpediemonas membranifera]